MEPSPDAAPAAWQRPYHEPSGTRGDALLFYVLFGDFAGLENFDLDRTRYRTSGLPPDGTLDIYPNDGNQNGAFAAFLAGHLGILLDKDQPEVAAAVRAAPSCIRLLATVADPADLVYLRDTLGLVTSLLFDAGRGVAVLDALALRWLTPAEWKSELWEPDAPQSTHHTTILVDEEEPERGKPRSVWVHTRGLRKFGRPDISVRRVTQNRFDLVVALCNRFIELQARGGLISEGQPIRIPDESQDWRCRHAGDYDDPDFNNVHIEIGPDKDR
jgi:hypothetical protein